MDNIKENNVVEGQTAECEKKNETQVSTEVKQLSWYARGKNFCKRHKTAILTVAAFGLGAITGAKLKSNTCSSEDNRSDEAVEETTYTETTVEMDPEE